MYETDFPPPPPPIAWWSFILSFRFSSPILFRYAWLHFFNKIDLFYFSLTFQGQYLVWWIQRWNRKTWPCDVPKCKIAPFASNAQKIEDNGGKKPAWKNRVYTLLSPFSQTGIGLNWYFWHQIYTVHWSFHVFTFVYIDNPGWALQEVYDSLYQYW